MREKKLKSMGKAQLLAIMREQELEIRRLTAEKDELAKNQELYSGKEEVITKYLIEFEKLVEEKNELAEKCYRQGLEIQRLENLEAGKGGEAGGEI